MNIPSGIWPSTDANGLDLIDPISVNHQGTVVLLARQRGAPVDFLYFNVMVASDELSSDAGLWQGWNYLQMQEPTLGQPAPVQASADESPMLRVGGIDLITVPPLAKVLSPADAPFCVVSDGKYLSVFRRSTDNTLYVDRFVLVQGQPPTAGRVAATAAATTWAITRTWEVRFRRSEQRDVPSGLNDTLDSRNMLEQPFLEPTTELVGIAGLGERGFDVLRAPTQDPQQSRWHFVTCNASSLSLVSFPSDSTGRVLIKPGPTLTITPTVLLADQSTSPLTISFGVSAELFAERETVADSPTSLARGVRLMVAVPVACVAAGGAPGVAVLDFLVQPDGTLPNWPALAPLVVADGSLSSTGFVPASPPAGSPTGYPLPDAAVHVVGTATTTGVFLGQTQPRATPFLYSSSAGIVHLYFQGLTTALAVDPFLVAQFDPAATRAMVQVPWTAGSSQTGNVLVVAERTGSSFNDMQMSITDCPGQTDWCTVTFNYGAQAGLATETWQGVPRELLSWVAVLDGEAASSPADPRVLSGEQPYYDYAGARAQLRLPVGPAAAPTDHVGLVSRRSDLPLVSANLSAATGAVATLTLVFGSAAKPVTQTWPALPLDAEQAAAVLSGDASASGYAYKGAVTDDSLFALTTSLGTILLVRAARDPALQVGVLAPTDPNPLLCNLSLTVGSALPTVLENIGRNQESVVAALLSQNVFKAVSADPASGSALNQTVSQPLDLRATASLFDLLAARSAGTLAAGTSVTAGVLQGRTPVSTSLRLQAASVVPRTQPRFGELARVSNGTSTSVSVGTFGLWRVAEQPKAFESKPGPALSVDLTQPQASRLVPGRRWTVEAWCRPTTGKDSRVVSYNGGPATELMGVVPSYFLGTTGVDALAFQPYVPQPQRSTATFIAVGSDSQFDLASPSVTALTWEAWINPNAAPCAAGTLGSVVEARDTQTQITMIPLWQLAVDPNRTLVFAWRSSNGGAPSQAQLLSSVPLAANTWSHVAVTAQRFVGGWTFQLYLNGVPDNQKQGALMFRDLGAPVVTVGTNDLKNVTLFGSIAELRIWKTARSRAEIDRTMDTSLSGHEPGLYAYWPLVEAPAQGAVFKNHAVATAPRLFGHMQQQDQTVRRASDGTFVSIVAGAGGRPPIESGTFLRSTHWNHIAAVYEASGGLRLNMNAFSAGRLDYGASTASAELALTTQNSIEAWIAIPAITASAQTLLASWGPLPSEQSFQFGIATDGSLYFSANVVARNVQRSGEAAPELVTARSTLNVCDSKPHHVVATWSMDTATSQQGNANTVTCTIALYVDGALLHTTFSPKVFATNSARVVSATAPLTVGISALETTGSGVVAIETQAPLVGIITGLRFWSIALNDAQVASANLHPHEADRAEGLLAAWWFDEDDGLVAQDSRGDADFTLSDTDMWCAFASIATLRIYGNGILVGRHEALVAPDYLLGAAAFTMGAAGPAGALTHPFTGDITELRLWATARTQNQLLESMYHPQVGSERALQAYWRFDGNALDQTTGGNNASAIGAVAYVASTAPVGNEGPQVRNVYSGPTTDFQEPVHGTPAVLDYGDTERDADNALLGILRRAYFFNNPNLTVSTKYSVGELDLVYIGMAQTNPTLIGYIEGAPPVPSENLTRPLYLSYLGYNGYADASTVSLTQAATTSLTYSSSDFHTSISMDLDVKAGLFGAARFGISSPFFNQQDYTSKIKIGLHNKESFFRARQDDVKYVSSWTRTQTTVTGLRGAWEPGSTSADYVNPQVGRRYQPYNIGYALVESLTADVFAMSLKGSGASVGKVVVPNLSIPPDRNILTFQIKPQYTKNGTLDGKVGLADDTNYTGTGFQHGSYFKPEEAYKLKGQIQRSEQNAQAYFAQFNSADQGQNGNANIEAVAAEQNYNFSTHTTSRAIANTYVWSAESGLYKDEEQTAASLDRVFNGLYSLSWGLGPLVDVDWAFKIGVFGGIDLLLGGQIKVQVGKGKLEQAQVSLSVTAPGEPFLASYINDKYTQQPTPGKVLSYRFMSFFLPPSTGNADALLDQVIDTNWKDGSDDPNAIALRSARIRGGSVWRVLHRVTYVSRVPPAIDGSPLQKTAPERQWDVAIDDNLLLIELVNQALSSAPPTPVNVGKAVASVLAPRDGSKAALSTLVPWWQAFVDKTKGTTPDAVAAAALLGKILDNTCSYLTAGYKTGVIRR